MDYLDLIINNPAPLSSYEAAEILRNMFEVYGDMKAQISA